MVSYLSVLITRFQFLIGTLQTALALASLLPLGGFNSLQVRYKLNSLLVVFFFLDWSFNSLQVRYKPKSEIPSLVVQRVSIPYRYATNYGLSKEPNIEEVRFNSLQVRYKQATGLRNRGVKTEFQFLIGTLQTWTRTESYECNKAVSIPYRYATNTSNNGYTGELELGFNSLQVRYKRWRWRPPPRRRRRFQFLIGTLQTALFQWVSEVIRCMFQFLIGTLQTHLSSVQHRLNAQFQFLIGTLQTYNLEKRFADVEGRVSIPYRYATNILISVPYCAFTSCFNSLQVRYKLQYRRGMDDRENVSIPYRYATNVAVSLWTKQLSSCVSIPYRYATNMV